jgi:hypothetical protein
LMLHRQPTHRNNAAVRAAVERMNSVVEPPVEEPSGVSRSPGAQGVSARARTTSDIAPRPVRDHATHVIPRPEVL